MTNLMLGFVLGSWLCAASPAHTASRNHEAVYAKGQATLVEMMKIGGGDDEGDDPPVFYRPLSLCVAGDGTIYVLDHETKEILAFDRKGEFLFRFSREGEGPGELREPNHIALDAGGRVVCYESGNKRFSFFSARGKFIRTVKFADNVPGFTYLPDGRILALTGRDRNGPGKMENVWTLAVLDSSFKAVAALDSITTRYVVVSIEGGISATSRPYEDFLYWCTSPDGRVYFAKSYDYKITVTDEHLAPVRTITRDVPAVKISGAERDAYVKDVPAIMVPHIKFPDRKPRIMGLYCDHQGYLLVSRARPDKDPPLLDVYRPDGSFLGELRVPGLSRPVFDGDTMLMRVFSDDELPAVIRYRLE